MKKLILTDHSFIIDLLFNTGTDIFNYFYRGEITYDLTNYIISLAEARLKHEKMKSKTKKRVFHIMVESIQNISRHQQSTDDDFLLPFFAIQKYKTVYFITTGNLIKNEFIDTLKNKIEILNQKSVDELTEYYKRVLGNGTFSEKGGAGLGLIEMVRKSGRKLEYFFEKINREFSFFYLRTSINTEEQEPSFIPSVFTFSYVRKLHRLLYEQKILLVYSSFFDQKSLHSLISLLNNQLQHDLLFKKRIISSLVELLQNIIRHGKIEINGKHIPLGIFYITSSQTAICLHTINYFPTEKTDFLDRYLNRINNMSEQELEDFYNSQLFNISDDDSTVGLGLVEIRMKSKNKIYYDIVRLDDKKSLVAIQICFQKNQ